MLCFVAHNLFIVVTPWVQGYTVNGSIKIGYPPLKTRNFDQSSVI